MIMRILALFLVLFLTSACDEGNKKPPLKNGEPALSFQATRLDGKSLNFPGDFQGRPVVIRFWADWCAFCKKEMVEIETVWQEKKSQNLVVLAVNAGQKKDEVSKFIQSLKVNYDIVLDENSAITKLYSVTGLPVTLFISKEGKLVSKILGPTDEPTFRKMVEEIL